jgi:hypothetical protein
MVSSATGAWSLRSCAAPVLDLPLLELWMLLLLLLVDTEATPLRLVGAGHLPYLLTTLNLRDVSAPPMMPTRPADAPPRPPLLLLLELTATGPDRSAT